MAAATTTTKISISTTRILSNEENKFEIVRGTLIILIKFKIPSDVCRN